MSLTAPYTNAMRIGQGFNTYTQDIRLENAVRVGASIKTSTSTECLRLPKGSAALPSTPPFTPDTHAIVSPFGDNPAVAVNGHSLYSADSNGRVPSPPPSPKPVMGGAIDVVSTSSGELPFELPSGPVPTTSQSVTYSTRAIENVSDIMDALNISTSMSIKYGTIHGNGNASFVNENKVLDSELNYVVSVIVNNDAQASVEELEFLEIPDLPLDRFTEVYGDAFISGFTEGGQFNAVISVKLNDKSKHKAVKQAIDVQLAVGPPTLEIGAQEAFEKEHNEALQNTEISISVNWVGGGEIKKPGVPWTIKSVVAVANAFPSMVARSSARTQAILTKYSSLRSFQSWKWKMLLEKQRVWEADPANKKGGTNNKDGTKRFVEPTIILNYVPCSLYTADLFDALMSYKKLWKTIGDMLKNPSMYKTRSSSPKRMLEQDRAYKEVSPLLTKKLLETDSPVVDSAHSSSMGRTFTFDVEGGGLGWNLESNNSRCDPIPPEPVALNEARLLCREAMTLITEEASLLVDHPHLAYAEFDDMTKSTRMKKPNYAYPDVLRQRLPVPIHNDVLSDLSTDGAYLKTIAYAKEDNLWFETDMVGDPKNEADMQSKFGPWSKYDDFCTLEYTEARGVKPQNPLRRITLHKYRLHSLNVFAKSIFKQAENAIGAIGLAGLHDDRAVADPDGCSHHLGGLHHSDKSDSSTYKSLDVGDVDITRIDVAYVPSSGYIAGLTFYDQVDGKTMERMKWRQWEGKEPAGLVTVTNEPPDRGDGSVWKFAGLAGSWVDTVSYGHLLARVSGIWKREEAE